MRNSVSYQHVKHFNQQFCMSDIVTIN